MVGGLGGMKQSGNTVNQVGAGIEQRLGRMEGIHQRLPAAEGVKGAWKVNLPSIAALARTDTCVGHCS
jgi:hypothetical protein